MTGVPKRFRDAFTTHPPVGGGKRRRGGGSLVGWLQLTPDERYILLITVLLAAGYIGGSLRGGYVPT
jgi:hypothetical protein